MTDDQPQRTTDPVLAPGLYLVATPIGNLEDITLRALRVLRSVDRIACEDTRHTQKLLNHFGIVTPTVSYHMHNEASRTGELVAAVQQGARIALVSDAGTPAISDPGAVVVAAAISAGIAVYPVPGPSAVISAYCASGLAAEESTAGFLFLGFLPAKQGQRRSALENLKNRPDGDGQVAIIYEAPHRIIETLKDIEAIFGPSQEIVLARELTKIHEEFLRGTVHEVQKTLAAREAIRGEMVLLFRPSTGSPTELSVHDIASQVRQLIEKEGIDEKEALKRVAKARGIGKSEAYRELQRSRKR